MRKSFAVVAMAVVSDTDAPETTQNLIVRKYEVDEDGGDILVDIPVSIQNFSDRDKFAEAIRDRALRLWDLHEQIKLENSNANGEMLN